MYSTLFAPLFVYNSLENSKRFKSKDGGKRRLHINFNEEDTEDVVVE